MKMKYLKSELFHLFYLYFARDSFHLCEIFQFDYDDSTNCNAKFEQKITEYIYMTQVFTLRIIGSGQQGYHFMLTFISITLKNFIVLISEKRAYKYFRVKCLLFINNVHGRTNQKNFRGNTVFAKFY